MAVITKVAVGSKNEHAVVTKTFVIVSSLVVALGGVLFGYDLVIISGAVAFFKNHFSLTDTQVGWAVGCINVGAALGALLAGKLSDLIGRKKLLLLCAFLFAITGVGTGWASSFNLFIISRILSGVAVGAAALVCPVYVSEIAPAQLRGRLVTLYQLAITVGLLLAYIASYLLLDSGENNWRWMFSSQSIPALFFFIGLFFVPETPRYLIKVKRLDEADKVLRKVGGPQFAATEFEAITQSFQTKSKESLKDLFKYKYRHIVFLGIMIAVFSQADGQNSLFSYSNEIFAQAGVAQDSAFRQSVLLGVINFLLTFFAIRTVDKIGRKKLLLYGAMLLSLNALYLAFCFWFALPGWTVLVGMLTFIGIFAATLGPVTWVILSEIFPNMIRGNAMAMATLALWIANFLTTTAFPILKHHLGLGTTFLIHAIICFIYYWFVKKEVPETKNKSLEEIEVLLERT